MGARLSLVSGSCLLLLLLLSMKEGKEMADWYSDEAIAERKALYEAKVAKEEKSKERVQKFFGLFKKVFKFA